MAYVEGVDREQLVFTSLDMMVAPDSPARLVDALVGSLDMDALGFPRAEPAATGRPAYDPRALLKLLLWGNMERCRSSRQMARACLVNVEARWLVAGVEPDFRTVADFRRANAPRIRAVFHELNARVAAAAPSEGPSFQSVDGTKVRASNSKDRNFTASKLDDRIARLDAQSADWMRRVEEADAAEDDAPPRGLTREEAEAKVAELEERKARYEGYLARMEAEGLAQLSLTDPESKLMRSRGGFEVSYNVQASVEAGTHLITNYEATCDATDHGHLAPTLAPLRADGEVLEATADKGYQQPADLLACLESGVLPSVVPPEGADGVAVEAPFEPLEGEAPTASAEPDDLRACIRSGAVPEAYEGRIAGMEVVEVRRLAPEGDGAAAPSPRLTEAQMRERAAGGRFVRDPDRDLVICPAGNVLRRKSERPGGAVRYCNKLACKGCPHLAECRKGSSKKYPFKVVEFADKQLEKPCRGWEGGGAECAPAPARRYETVKVVRFTLLPDLAKTAMRKRLSEHPFGTIKRALGGGHFLLRGRELVDAEFGLLAIAYNLRRGIGLLGFDGMAKALA